MHPLLLAALAGLASAQPSTSSLTKPVLSPVPVAQASVIRAGVPARDDARIAVQARDFDAAFSAVGIKPLAVHRLGSSDWALVTLDTNTRVQADAAITALASHPAVEFASPVFVGDDDLPSWPTAGVMIGFDADTSSDWRDALATAADCEPGLRRWEHFPDLDLLPVASRNGLDVLAAAEQLAQLPGVVFAHPSDMLIARQHVMPNDPMFGDQWGLHNVHPAPLFDQDMDLPEAWDLTTGRSTIVAMVFESGVDIDHPDFNAAPFNADFIRENGDTGGRPGNACDNHGTAVAGCITAKMNNGLLIAGVAPDCKTASARIGFANCDGTMATTLQAYIDAFNWAITNGVRVTNNSNGFGGVYPVITAAYVHTQSIGMVHFASTGNNGTGTIGFPASSDGVIAIGALRPDGTRASFSQYGTGLDLSAPGESILTLDRSGAAGDQPGDVTVVHGTSFASPYAAAVACLVLSRNPMLTSAEVENILQLSATDRGASGYDTTYGYGFVNARRALELTSIPSPPNDSCANAVDVSGGGTFPGDLTFASNDGTSTCGSSSTNRDIWYRYTNPGAAPVRANFTTCGTHDMGGVDAGVDTVLSLYSGCGVSAFNCVDDAPGVCTGAQGLDRDSSVEHLVQPGETILVRISHYSNTAVGPVQLTVTTSQLNDACANAIPVTLGGSYVGSTFNATVDGASPCVSQAPSSDVWYTYTQGDCAGRVVFDTCGSQAAYGSDTVLTLYSACGGDIIGCNDDNTGQCGPADPAPFRDSTISTFLTPGQSVRLRVGHFGNSAGNFQLHVSGQVADNDTCAAAFEIADGSYPFCNLNASTDGFSEPQCNFFAEDQVNNDLWFRYNASVNGMVTATTCDAFTFDTKLAIYAGGCPTAPGTAIGCDDDTCDFGSRISFAVTAGQSYLIRVGAYEDQRGTGILRVDTDASCPADFNGDGFMDFFDYDDFVACFETGNCPAGRDADFNGDDFVDFFDYDDFVTAFEVGC